MWQASPGVAYLLSHEVWRLRYALVDAVPVWLDKATLAYRYGWTRQP